MDFLLSFTICIFGLMTAIHKNALRRKKDRIDKYYVKLNNYLDVLKSKDIPNKNELQTIKTELQNLHTKAFQQLIDEKLTSDISFVIFQNLLRECFEKINQLQKQ